MCHFKHLQSWIFENAIFFYSKLFFITKESQCFLQNQLIMSTSQVIRPNNTNIKTKLWKKANMKSGYDKDAVSTRR